MNELTAILAEPVVRMGATTITLGQALGFGAFLFCVLVVVLAVALWRSARARAAVGARLVRELHDPERSAQALDELVRRS